MSHIHHLLHKNASALRKTGSYYVVHVVVAAGVGVCRDGRLAGCADTEPAGAQRSGRGVLSCMTPRWLRVPLQRWRTLAKTASYYAVHLVVAAGVAYAVTGDWWMALTLSLLEPTVQMLFFFVHEKLSGAQGPARRAPCRWMCVSPRSYA